MALGLIVEYNPFHNGHQYHIARSVEVTGVDRVICAMSGDFLQRGEPAWVRKAVRVRAALQCGADLVLQVPVAFSCASADIFAHGAVALLDSTGVVSDLCFGSESGDIGFLEAMANRIATDPAVLVETLERQRNGLAFPVARAAALTGPAGSMKPNNILGLEYLVSLHRIGSFIRPSTILRRGADYRDASLPSGNSAPEDWPRSAFFGPIASATAIRATVSSNLEGPAASDVLGPISKFCPGPMSDGIREEFVVDRFPVCWSDYDGAVLALFRRLDREEIGSYRGIDPVLAGKLKDASARVGSVRGLAEAVKIKNITWTRIYRSIAAVFIGFRESASSLLNRRPGYIRVLGFNRRGRELLAEIRRKSSVPVVANVSCQWKAFNKFNARARIDRRKCAVEDSFSTDLGLDLVAARIYASGYENTLDRSREWDFESPIMV